MHRYYTCAMSEQLFDFKEQRDLLEQWADRKGDQGLHDYWESRNQVSIDGRPTGIISDESVPIAVPVH